MFDFCVLFLVGTIAGLSAGLFGIGGGIVIMPSLIFYFSYMNLPEDVVFRLSFGTSLFTIIFTSISSFIKHFRQGNIISSSIVPIGISSIIGGIAGSFTASFLPGEILKKIFSVILLYAVIRLFIDFRSKNDKIINDKLIYLFLTGIAAGITGALTGLGGGVILIPAMIVILNFPVKKVAGTSSGIIIFIAIASTLGYIYNGTAVIGLPEYSIGYVNIKAAIPLLIGAVVAAPFGAALNFRLKSKALKIIFAVFMSLMAVKIAFF